MSSSLTIAGKRADDHSSGSAGNNEYHDRRTERIDGTHDIGYLRGEHCGGLFAIGQPQRDGGRYWKRRILFGERQSSERFWRHGQPCGFRLPARGEHGIQPGVRYDRGSGIDVDGGDGQHSGEQLHDPYHGRERRADAEHGRTALCAAALSDD
jgi:hypothetical protein